VAEVRLPGGSNPTHRKKNVNRINRKMRKIRKIKRAREIRTKTFSFIF
jgi:hypothetical protein